MIRSRTKIDEIQQRREEELKSINLRVQKLQSDLMNANQVRAACDDHRNIYDYNEIITIVVHFKIKIKNTFFPPLLIKMMLQRFQQLCLKVSTC